MKSIFKFFIAFCTIAALPSAFAQENHQVSLINHFSKPLSFVVGINPQVLPGFPKQFALKPNEQITSTVLDLKKESYIRGEDDQKDFVFFGVALVENQVKIYGYLSKNVAYSWKNQVITFCMPEFYKNNGKHC